MVDGGASMALNTPSASRYSPTFALRMVDDDEDAVIFHRSIKESKG
jgi:hypothetical protein